jgi:hypothetical protein
MVAVFTALSVIGLVAYGLFVQNYVFDRYLWVLVLSSGLLIVSWLTRPPGGHFPSFRAEMLPARRGWGLIGVITVFSAVITLASAAVTLNADAYDGARWAAGQIAVRAGIAPSNVDAGVEWVGMHSSAVAVPGRLVPSHPPYETWYDQMFPGFRDCAIVSASPLALRKLSSLGQKTYRELGFTGRERLYIYRVHGLGCS